MYEIVKKVSLYFLLAFHLTSFLGCSNLPELPEATQAAYDNLPEQLDFNQHIKPILSDKCFACHGPDKAKISAGLQLHSDSTAYSELPESPGKFAIVKNNPKKSEMIARILNNDPKYIMPTPESHLTLTHEEKAMLIKWIEEGAEYKKHWAFIPPKKIEKPSVKNQSQIKNEIDSYLLSDLEKKGFTYTKLASKEILLRRLSLGLTGLPPTIEEIDQFLKDSDENAFEKQIDRLLNSKHYGENMAVSWMDLSRFADTHGYSVDRYRDMSTWRDWVISAFNKNQPYDEFVTWQLAGDLLPNATRDMKIATAFNRIHPQNMEGGIINEEFLVEYAVDRVSTVGQAFLGLTVACARCHDHKYDPVSHKNFYQMSSFFNNINEAGQISWNDALPTPTLMLSTEKQDKIIALLDGKIKRQEEVINQKKQEVLTLATQWIDRHDYKKIPNPTQGLIAHYTLDNQHIKNALPPFQKATMKRGFTENQPIKITKGFKNNALKLNGDTWLDLKSVGRFGRHQPFTVNVWAFIPKEITDGNIFHKGDGAILNAWRGFHLKIVKDHLEVVMAHTAPDNMIKTISKEKIPKEKWINLTLSYDGSSKAKGLKVYVDGNQLESKTIIDNLYKDILFRKKREPGLQFGARFRGKGIKDARIDEIKIYNTALSEIAIKKLSKNNELNQLMLTKPEQLTPMQRKLLADYFINKNRVITNEKNLINEFRKAYVDSVEQVKEVMVMKESAPVQSYVLDRGVYDAKKEKVYPSTPNFLPPMDKESPKNRLGFAKWLFKKEHPLTARVAVNRIWQQLFGIGLVKTSEDFGNQGEMPSNLALLDHLSLYFMENNWDIKKLIKYIVSSSAYQQSSMPDIKIAEKLLSWDPENRFLGRGPASRMTGEMLRDNALAAGGLLNKTIGGESVKPYQPKGLWKVNGGKYVQDSGDKLYRRSLYSIWKRSVPNPTIASFDAPNRNICITRRQNTNTPLQALVLLNDPTFIEAARVIGKEMTSYDLENSINYAFRVLTGRKAKKTEIKTLVGLHQKEIEKFRKLPKKMNGWLNTGEYKLNENDDKALIAANAVVANTIMNSDASIMIR